MLESLGRLRPVGYLNPAVGFALGASEGWQEHLYTQKDLCQQMFSLHSIYQTD